MASQMEEEIRAYRLRLYPSKKQVKVLENQLNLCKQLYNKLLQKCIEDYKKNKTSLCNNNALNKICNEIRDKDQAYDTIYSQAIQNTRIRVVTAFSNFFRRIKEKKQGKKVKAGFPRFKKFYKSITYPQNNGSFQSVKNEKALQIAKIGNIPIVKHREMEGSIKTLTIKRTRSGNWHAILTSIITKDTIPNPKPNNIGIDVGIESFATLSNGTKIENPRHLIKAEKKLKKLQRKLSRKKPGSNRRRKAKLKVARMHEKITNQRHGFLHKLSRALINNYSLIAVENLKVSNMLHNHNLAKHISDASWNEFLQMLYYKASSAGRRVICVDPRNTSQICSNCSKEVRKDLSVRVHECPYCGLTIDRDWNAAINILKRATAGLAGSHAQGDSASTLSLKDKACRVKELGTIRCYVKTPLKYRGVWDVCSIGHKQEHVGYSM